MLAVWSGSCSSSGATGGSSISRAGGLAFGVKLGGENEGE